MKVIFGADHRGFSLKTSLLQELQHRHSVVDLGTNAANTSDDYPDIAKKVGEEVQSSQDFRGVVLCGSGAGVDIVANKLKGIRCCLALNREQVISARKDDNINVLALAADFTDTAHALSLVNAFLDTPFEPTDSHIRRLEKITAIEEHA
jgi:ribose 5-phosphate isomerase B